MIPSRLINSLALTRLIDSLWPKWWAPSLTAFGQKESFGRPTLTPKLGATQYWGRRYLLDWVAACSGMIEMCWHCERRSTALTEEAP